MKEFFKRQEPIDPHSLASDLMARVTEIKNRAGLPNIDDTSNRPPMASIEAISKAAGFEATVTEAFKAIFDHAGRKDLPPYFIPRAAAGELSAKIWTANFPRGAYKVEGGRLLITPNATFDQDGKIIGTDAWLSPPAGSVMEIVSSDGSRWRHEKTAE